MFGRINYAYDSRYLAEFSIRRDGSSRFIGDKTWGTFPSIALGWNIANEQFFKPLNKTVNTLKLRLTYGSLGNTNTDQLYPGSSDSLLAQTLLHGLSMANALIHQAFLVLYHLS